MWGKLTPLTYTVTRLDGSEVRSAVCRLPFVPPAPYPEYRGNGQNYIRGEKGRFAGSRPGGGSGGSAANNSLDFSGESGIIEIVKDDVVIPIRKLTEYALNPEKEPNKARVFKSVLGFDINSADILIERIREGFDAKLLKEKPNNGYGKRYEALITVKGINGNTAKVTTAWFDDPVKMEFRLTSLYIKTGKRRS